MASDERRLIAVVKIEGEVQPVTFDYKLEFYSRVNGYIKQGKSTAYWIFTSRRTLINNSRRCLPCCLSVWIYPQVFRGRHLFFPFFYASRKFLALNKFVHLPLLLPLRTAIKSRSALVQRNSYRHVYHMILFCFLPFCTPVSSRVGVASHFYHTFIIGLSYR